MPLIFLRSCPGGAFPAVVVAAVLAGAPTAALAQCPASFTVGPAWTMGTPYSVSVGDFNADGRLDFAAANFGGANATVRLASQFIANDFPLMATYPLNLNPRGSQSADFNHDGRADLAVAYMGGGPENARLAVMMANANGTLADPVLYTLPGAPTDLELADLNGDGNKDILIVTAFGHVAACIANANGTFQPAVIMLNSVEANGVAVTDINRDGTLDLVTTRYNDPPQVRVSLGIPGSGGLSYAAYTPYTVPNNWGPWGIDAGDFNNDGRGDVVVTHRVSGSAGVLLGNANGSLTPMPVAGASSWPQDVVTADFNGDGLLDVAVGNWGPGNGVVSVLLGNGAGGLGARSNFTCGTSLNGVRAADMNNDGKMDIVVANQGIGTVQILYNTTPVTLFNPAPFAQYSCPNTTVQFYAAATTTQAGGITGYRWQGLIGSTWTNLSDGPLANVGTVSGSSTQQLTISGVIGTPGSRVISVRAVALTACGGNPSAPGTLDIIRACGPADLGGPGGVPTPCGGDGVLDNNDFIAFINYFFEGNLIADFGVAAGFPGQDGLLDNNDFVAFINSFFAGCP